MSKTILNFWLDALLLVMFLLLVWVSTILQWIFPAASSAHGWTLWGYTYDEWQGLQYTVLAIFTLEVLLHVMLHWSWVCGVIATKIIRGHGKPDYGMQTIYGVILLIGILVLIGVGVGWAQFTIVKPY